MMRNDDIDEIDLSRHRPSRLPGVLIIGAAIGVALIAAWFFAPILMSKDAATTASLLPAPKAGTAGPALASAQAPVSAAEATAAAAPQDPAPAAAPARTAPETTASTQSPWNAQPWPPSRGVQVAAAPPSAVTPPEADSARLAAVAPQDTPADATENVPLPRKRPSRLIAASLAIPLPRPRPEIEAEAPSGPPTTFDLQVERMR
jgi:hypothetical protein